MAEESKKFVPGNETPEQFAKVLELLCEWIKGGIVSVDVDSDGDIDFDLPGEMEDLLSTQLPAKLSVEDVRGIVQGEIRALVAAGLSQQPRKSLARRMPEQVKPDLDEMVRRCTEVHKHLVTASLKERMLLRRMTTAYVLDDIEWKSCTYHVEDADDKKIDLPCISLNFAFVKPNSPVILGFATGELSRMTVSRRDDVSVVLELHKEDVKKMVDKLNAILQTQCD